MKLLKTMAALLGLSQAGKWEPHHHIKEMTNNPATLTAESDSYIQIRIWIDLLCPDSKATYEQMVEIFTAPVSPFMGSVVARFHLFPLSYHDHAFEVAQMIPYLFDVCDDTEPKGKFCWVNQYYDWIWKNQDTFRNAHDQSQTSILRYHLAEWSKDYMGLDPEAIECFNSNEGCDTHNTIDRVRKAWKYGAGIGVYGTPNVFINDVQLAQVPSTKDDWVTLINSIAQDPIAEADSRFMQ